MHLVEVARPAPLGKLISCRRLDHGSCQAEASEQHRLAGIDAETGGAVDNVSTACEDRDPPASGIDVVTAGLREANSVARKIDLDAFVVAEPAERKADPSPRDGELDNPSAQFGDFDLGVLG